MCWVHHATNFSMNLISRSVVSHVEVVVFLENCSPVSEALLLRVFQCPIEGIPQALHLYSTQSMRSANSNIDRFPP